VGTRIARGEEIDKMDEQGVAVVQPARQASIIREKEHPMKPTHLALAALSAALAFAAPAIAQQPVTQKPMQMKDAGDMAKAVTVTATVMAVDLKNREVTLKGPAGNEFAVAVTNAVKNLDKVHVGDTVDATYIQAVALDFQKGDGIRMAESTTAADRAAAGHMPGAAAVKQTTVVTNIWAMDPTAGTVTVLGPFGHLTEVHLKDPAQLAGVKVGDQMKITYTQALATAVVKKS
jgi:hypothetical protein